VIARQRAASLHWIAAGFPGAVPAADSASPSLPAPRCCCRQDTYRSHNIIIGSCLVGMFSRDGAIIVIKNTKYVDTGYIQLAPFSQFINQGLLQTFSA